MATEKSINTVFVQLVADVGIRETAETARALGIGGIDPDKPGDGGPVADLPPEGPFITEVPRPEAMDPAVTTSSTTTTAPSTTTSTTKKKDKGDDEDDDD